MDEARQNVPICPGCHFRCPLDEYQCARGAKFNGMWQAGEEIPERRMPKPPKDGEKPAGGPPPQFRRIPIEARLLMGMSFFQRIMDERQQETAKQRVAECIQRQDGFAANGIIAERTRRTDGQIQEQAEALQAEGFVAPRTEPDGRLFYELTEQGKEQVEVWAEERQQADAELFAALSDEEKEQLHELLSKALGPHMRRGPKPRE